MAQLQAPAPTTPTIREADHVAVYTRATWSAAWTLQRYLYPTGRAILRAAPGFSRIELAYDFGDVKREDQAAHPNVRAKDAAARQVFESLNDILYCLKPDDEIRRGEIHDIFRRVAP